MRIIACQECKRQWDVSRYRVGEKLRCVCNHVMEVPRAISYSPEVHHCESCGAARASRTGACRYCGSTPTADASRLSLVCPFCLHRMPERSKFCATCGKPIRAKPLDAKTGKLRCPRCRRTKLVNRKVDSFTVDECPGCSGLWVDNVAFEGLVALQAEREKESVGATRGMRPEKDRLVGGVTYIKCPKCQRLMNRVNFARVSGVVIDECRKHGVWLDCDELGKIATYISTGGLRHSKELEESERAANEARVHVPIPGMNEFPPIRTGSEQPTPLGSILDIVVGKLF